MLDWDVIIVGGGPAGLTAGLYLSRGRYRTLLLEKENFGGQIKNVEWIENYPGFARGVAGPTLASEMVTQATSYNLQLEQAEVTKIELYSGCRSVQCADGRDWTAEAVVLASGCRRKKLGVPGEQEFEGRGVIKCALCDGDQFSSKVVVVCGGGDSGVTEALYLTKLASRVILLEAEPLLTANAVLQERALSNQKLEIHCGIRVMEILGNKHVEAIAFEDVATGQRGTRQVEGILVDIGLEPNTAFLETSVKLDSQGQICVNERMETSVPYVFAAGDIRGGSPKQVVTAVGDGATAAIFIQRLGLVQS
jgi:thioredoxin reductase (NADPH)